MIASISFDLITFNNYLLTTKLKNLTLNKGLKISHFNYCFYTNNQISSYYSWVIVFFVHLVTKYLRMIKPFKSTRKVKILIDQ